MKILTGNAGSIWILVGVLHVFHEGFTAEEELVTDGTACSVGAAEKGGVLLEHNTLLQLLVCPMDTQTPESTQIPTQSCAPEAQDRRAQNRTIPVRVKAHRCRRHHGLRLAQICFSTFFFKLDRIGNLE